jgi:myo-inositol-1(or 4)-monophosphatase
VHPLVNIAVSAARAAGNQIMRNLDRVDQLQITRKERNDFVNEVCWIIDPLDGTTNFLHRLPHFAVSIGIQVRGKLEHGVIYAPCTQDLYTASRGGGAQLNNRRVRVSGTIDMTSALIGTGVPIRASMLDAYMPMLQHVAEQTAGVRRAGAASLDLAYVAAGRLDAFWELNLKPWDIAAGMVLVQEAGGIVSEIYGKDDALQTGHIIAGTPKIHAPLAEAIGEIAQSMRFKPGSGEDADGG